MKKISLRKAGNGDYDMYKKLYDKYDFLHKINFENEAEQEEKSKKIIQELLINTSKLKQDEETFYKGFIIKLDDIRIIEVDDEIAGYIYIIRRKKSVKIAEMSISDYSIMNEIYLSKLIDCLFHDTRAENIWLIIPNNDAKKMFCNIGFEESECHTIKRAQQ